MAKAAGPLQVSSVSVSNGFQRLPAFLSFLFSQVPVSLQMSAVARPRPFPCEVKRLCMYMGLTLVRSHVTRLNAQSIAGGQNEGVLQHRRKTMHLWKQSV